MKFDFGRSIKTKYSLNKKFIMKYMSLTYIYVNTFLYYDAKEIYITIAVIFQISNCS